MVMLRPMPRILAIILTLAAQPSAADLFASPSGDDANDCITAATPCRTLQAAADKAGRVGRVWLADGLYTAGAHVIYHRVVSFAGNCTTPGAVVVSTPGAVTFVAEDFAILTAQCMDIVGDTSTRAMFARQFAIMDAAYVRFGPMAVHVIANEKSKVNVTHATLLPGHTTYHLRTNGQSQIVAGGTMTIKPDVSFYAYASAAYQAMIDATGLTVLGSASGMKFIIDAGSLIAQPPGGLPGNLPGMCEPGCIMK
jgi:hypothetical protein